MMENLSPAKTRVNFSNIPAGGGSPFDVASIARQVPRSAARSCGSVCPGSTADDNDDAMMWLRHREMEKVVPVASQQQATIVVGKLEDGLVGGIPGKGFTQQRDIVTELLEQVAQAVGHVVVEQTSL